VARCVVHPFPSTKTLEEQKKETPQIQAHQRYASINSFIELVAMNHIIIDVNSSKIVISLCTS
jgi:hypothetical protein